MLSPAQNQQSSLTDFQHSCPCPVWLFHARSATYISCFNCKLIHPQQPLSSPIHLRHLLVLKLNPRGWVIWRTVLANEGPLQTGWAQLCRASDTATPLAKNERFVCARRLILACVRLQIHVLSCPEFESSYRKTAIGNRDHTVGVGRQVCWLLHTQTGRGERCFPSWQPSMELLTPLIQRVFPGCDVWDLFSFSFWFPSPPTEDKEHFPAGILYCVLMAS